MQAPPYIIRSIRFLYFLLLCITGSSFFTHAQLVSTLPFTMHDNHVYIYCRINGQDSLKFLFDTGANTTVFNSSSAKNPGLKTDGQIQNTGSNGVNMALQSRNNNLSFGQIIKSDVSLMLLPYNTDAFDGVFGTDLMLDYIVEIDHDRNEIRFYKPGSTGMDLTGYHKEKLHLVDGYPAIESRLILNDTVYSGLFGLDSGADDALTIASPFAKKHQLSKKMKLIGKATFRGSDGSEYAMIIADCPAIALSGKFLYNIPLTLSEASEGIDATDKMSGFYGNNVLKRFNMIIDLGNHTIYLKLNRHLYNSFG